MLGSSILGPRNLEMIIVDKDKGAESLKSLELSSDKMKWLS